MPASIFNGDYVKILKDKLKFKKGGIIEWDHTNGCPSYPSDIAGVNNQIGQEVHVRVYNGSGSMIPNGAVVYVNGADPDNLHPAIELAIANDYAKSRVLGIVTADIADGAHGIVTREGLVNDLDTSSYSSGDILFLSPTVAGAYQTAIINDENFEVRVGHVVKDDATTGSILVCHTAAHYTVETTQKTGWSNTYGPATMTFDNGTRTLTLTPVGTEFHFYQDGIKYAKTTDSIQITDVEGIHAIYYNAGVLVDLENPTDAQILSLIQGYVTVAYIGWNATDNEAVYFGNEMHDMQFPDLVHVYAHFAFGARYLNGLGLTGILSEQSGSLNSHAQFGVESGAIADEDRYIPTATIASTTGLPIFYLAGTSAAPVLRRLTNAGFSVSTTGTGRLAYNFLTGGNWTIAEVPSTKYVLCHVFCINENDVAKRMIAFMGQAQYATVALARAGATTEITTLVSTGIVPKEIKSIGTVIFQTSNAYTNSVKARIREIAAGIDYEDWRSVNNTGGSVSTSGTGTTIFSDSNFQVFDDADPTKSVQLQVSPVPTATNVILSVPPATDTLTGLAATQEFTNKSIGDELRLKEIAEPATPSAGYLKQFPKTDSLLYSKDDTGRVLPIHENLNEGFDFLKFKRLTDFATYNDGASTVPVNGTGGVVSYVSVASSASPIDSTPGVLNLDFSKTANNAQGEGFSVDFAVRGSIDEYAVRVVKIAIATGANYADGDWGVYLLPLDGSDTTLKYPPDQDIFASSFVSNQQFEFQLTDATNYRLIFHCQSTSALAYTNTAVIKFVETKTPTGGIVNWPDYDLTVTGTNWTTKSAKGIYYKTINGRHRLRFTITGVLSVGASSLTITIAGVTFRNVANHFQAVNTDYASGNYNTSSYTSPNTGNIVTTASGSVTAHAMSGDVELESQPAWAIDYSNQVLSEDTGSRIISTYIGRSSSQTGVNPNNSAVKILLNAVFDDTCGGADLANNRIYIQETGYYDLKGKVALAATNVLADKYQAAIYKNGSNRFPGVTTTAKAAASVTLEENVTGVKLTKGDYLELYVLGSGNNSVSTLTASDGEGGTELSVVKRSSPQQIATSPRYSGVYTSNTAQSLSNGTPSTMVFEDKVYDSGNIYTPATGGVSPINGFLTLVAQYQLAASSGWGVNEFQEVYVEVNGVTAALRDLYTQATIAGSWNPEPAHIELVRYPILKGQTFRLRGRQDSGGSISTSGITSQNYIQFDIEA